MTKSEREEAVRAWRKTIAPLLDSREITQEQVAARLSQLLGRAVDQSTVSKWRGEVTPQAANIPGIRNMTKEIEAGTWPAENGAAADGPVLVTDSGAAFDRQATMILERSLDEATTGYLLQEIKAGYRDAALRDLAAALLKAEENAARLSEERAGHRDAIIRMDENATIRALATSGGSEEARQALLETLRRIIREGAAGAPGAAGSAGGNP